MDAQGVLIQYENEQDGTIYNGSGLLLKNSIAVTTGACLAPFIQKCIEDNVANIDCGQLNRLLKTTILYEEAHLDAAGRHSKCTLLHSFNPTGASVTKPNLTFYETEARFTKTFRCEQIEKVLGDALTDWDVNNLKEYKSELVRQFSLSTIVLLQIDSTKNVKEESVFREFLDELMPMYYLERGDSVFLETTPFGNVTFLNTYSEGIVANIVGGDHCLFLTDASSAPGSEGGPIFLKRLQGERDPKRVAVGLVLSSISFWKDEWCGFTLGVSLACILQHIFDGVPRSSLFEKPPKLLRPEHIDNSILQISCGSVWGTGIYADSQKGLIVTSSHVVKTSYGKIIGSWKQESFELTLLYRTVDNMPFDIAILQSSSPVLRKMLPITFAAVPAIQGEAVLAFGYPFFRNNVHSVPTVTRGSVSRTGTCMLQTTCCIHPGASGGAIVRPNGELLGIVACNTANNATQTAYPHINMAVPAEVVRNAVAQYVKTSDMNAFNSLTSNDPLVLRRWNLFSSKL